ncbi:hypothetical protein NFI96_018889 [Prochilodus magdalenae]|nr:hypothetical protein NFI96_018889 [Prochilodus magdalenae]
MPLRDLLTLSVSHTLAGVYTLLWVVSFVQSKPPDVHVTCIYSEDCVLPCSFTPTGDTAVIQWYQQEKLIYSSQEDEDESDESRVSLFTDEMSSGNASLLLEDSRIQSRGRYRCLINTTQTVEESAVIVKVEAPIRKISIEAIPTGHMQCSSRGVYPAPSLMWSTDPSIGNLKASTRMTADLTGLYSAESTVPKVNRSSPLTYICTISPKYSSQSWKASLLQTEMVGQEDQDLVVPCMAPKNLNTFTLTWTFTRRNKNQEILTYHSQTHQLNEYWEEHAELDPEKARMGDGSLYLEDLEAKHSGKYTCTFSGPQVTYTVQTSVSISAHSATAQTDESKSKLWVLAVVVGVLAALAVVGVLYYLYRKYRGNPKAAEKDLELPALQKDAQVTCLFHEDCILPCSFRPTSAVVIHWYKQQIPVHSYYYNKDQFGLQNKHFSGRTSLFNSQIAQGNASLVLRKVKVQDRGRYKCYTSTRKGNQETFVNLGVKALIQLVKIELTEEKVTCLAQNIYPAPHLFWYTDPPTEPASLHNYTRNTADSKGLFTIESTVSVMGNISQYAYFCSVVSADGSQVWTASVNRQGIYTGQRFKLQYLTVYPAALWEICRSLMSKRNELIDGLSASMEVSVSGLDYIQEHLEDADELFGEEGSALLIPCMVPQPHHNFTLSWTFIRTNDPIIIFTYDSRTRKVSTPWENRADMDIEQAHVGNGSLTLLSPDSLSHSGVYTCTFSSFQMKHQVQTRVNVTVRVTDADESVCRRSWWGTAASVFIFVLTISVALSRCLRFRGDRQQHTNTGVRKPQDRRTHRTGTYSTPMLDQPALDEQRHNGSVTMETTDPDAPKFHKAKPDGLRGPPSPAADDSVLSVCVDQRDLSVHSTPVLRNAPRTPSPTSETPRPHTPGSTGGDRCEPGSAEAQSAGAEQDGEAGVSERVYVNEISSPSEPEPSQINGFSVTEPSDPITVEAKHSGLYHSLVPADGAVGVEVEGHQAFWTCDDEPFILVLTTVPPHTDSLGVSTKTKAGLVTEDDPLPF